MVDLRQIVDREVAESRPRFGWDISDNREKPGVTRSVTSTAEWLVDTAIHRLGADRCVVVRFERGADSVVLAAAGIPLCQPGTRLPIALSSMYCRNREGEVFVGDRLQHSAAFRRVSDRALVALGMEAAISVPQWHEGHVSGAIYVAVTESHLTDRPNFSVGRLVELASSASSTRGNFLGPNIFDSEMLTPREQEVLVALSSGLTNSQIGVRLTISPHTVSNHTRSIYRKLQVTSKVGALQKAHTLGLLNLAL